MRFRDQTARRTGFAALVLSGGALFATAVGGLAGVDGRLEAAERASEVRPVSAPAADCPREHHRLSES